MKPLNSLKIHFNLHRLGGLTKSQNKLELIPLFDLKCNFFTKVSNHFSATFSSHSSEYPKIDKKILEVLSGVTSLLNGAKLTSYWTMVFLNVLLSVLLDSTLIWDIFFYRVS